ncbi:MAG: heme A synthase [Burkholderiales bacterium]|nr:MAG: heme A synthase [Burkholderiales bacterium]
MQAEDRCPAAVTRGPIKLSVTHQAVPGTMPNSNDPVFWQFSLSAVNVLIWVAILLLAMWMGLRMRWSRLVAVTAFITLDLIAFGAFVRLTDSGLGCPDWPGCYGKFLPTQATAQINQAIAEQGGTHGPVSHGKAWIEMLHRYVATFIGSLILVMFFRALAAKIRPTRAMFSQAAANVGIAWPLLLLIVVSLQGLFGKWTVTLKLMPVIVTTHLLGGMTLFALLVWFWMRERDRAGDPRAAPIRVAPRTIWLTWIAIVVLYGQIFLGGWVSTNYAVLACADFPTCNGTLAPALSWNDAFTLWRELGKNPDGSFLTADALRTIHWAHRLGAIVATIFIVAASVSLMRADAALKRQALWIKTSLVLQILIGISTVVFDQPILVATAHNFFAAVLLATLVVAAFRLSPER